MTLNARQSLASYSSRDRADRFQAANASIAGGVFALAVEYRKKIIMTSVRGAAVNLNMLI